MMEKNWVRIQLPSLRVNPDSVIQRVSVRLVYHASTRRLNGVIRLFVHRSKVVKKEIAPLGACTLLRSGLSRRFPPSDFG